MDETGDPSHFVPLLPHVRLIAGIAEGEGLEGAGSLRNSLGYYLHRVADYAGAQAAFERALAIDEAAFGPDHPTVARDVNNLGSVLHALADYAGARESFERALAIDEAAFGPDHPEVARDVNNLGSVLRDLGDLAGARASFERALRILEKSLPPDHPNIRIVRGHLEGLG
jgi:Tfp pilus assembly protein PilF